jgi:hypothetical protein
VPVLSGFKDYDGDLLDDAVFDMAASQNSQLSALGASGSGLFARWLAGGAWYFAALDQGLVGVTPDVTSRRLSASVLRNPAVGAVDFRYTLPQECRVVLSVFDLAGRRVAKLADGLMGAGPHELRWQPPVSGAPTLYLYLLETPGQAIKGRFVVVH